MLLGAINANNIVCGLLIPVAINEHEYELITSQHDVEEYNYSKLAMLINNLKTLTVFPHFLFVEQSGQIAESGSQTILANDCQIWQYHP